MGEELVSYSLASFPAAAVRFVRALERNREKIALTHGLSATDLSALFHIGEVVSLTPKQLAEHMRLTTGAITAIANRLVTADLLERVDHPNDRRSLYLELSPHGHDVMAEIHRDFEGMIAAATQPLTPAQLEVFETALSTVANEVFDRLRD
jgi:DNA-binding MarR family transcriptional regulator